MSKIIIKSGTCGQSGCTEQHQVTALPLGQYWTGVQQYSGEHHGQSFVYEAWMVREVCVDGVVGCVTQH